MSPYASIYSVLETTSNLEESRKRLTKKLRRFSELPMNWSHGEGVPVTPSAISEAELLIVVASDLGLQADVFPNLDGGCAVAVYRGDERLEISVNPDCLYEVKIERGIGMNFDTIYVDKKPSRLDAIKALIGFRNHVWSLGSWIFDSTIEPVRDLEICSTEIQANLLMLPLQTTGAGTRSLL